MAIIDKISSASDAALLVPCWLLLVHQLVVVAVVHTLHYSAWRSKN